MLFLQLDGGWKWKWLSFLYPQLQDICSKCREKLRSSTYIRNIVFQLSQFTLKSWSSIINSRDARDKQFSCPPPWFLFLNSPVPVPWFLLTRLAHAPRNSFLVIKLDFIRLLHLCITGQLFSINSSIDF
jgi:hypothetical protein